MKNLEDFLIINSFLGWEAVERKKSASKSKTSSPRPRSKGIQNNELDMMADSIKEVFGGEVFMNKDFAAKGLLEKWGLTARQTPSRLKKLVEMGILEDCGGSPKSYKMK